MFNLLNELKIYFLNFKIDNFMTYMKLFIYLLLYFLHLNCVDFFSKFCNISENNIKFLVISKFLLGLIENINIVNVDELKFILEL